MKGFSPATVEHAKLTARESLDEFRDTTAEFRLNPYFDAAVILCLASRTAWLKVLPEWRIRGDEMLGEIKGFCKNLHEAADLIESFRRDLKDEQLCEKVQWFGENLQWRCRLCEVLLDTKAPRPIRLQRIVELEQEHVEKVKSRLDAPRESSSASGRRA